MNKRSTHWRMALAILLTVLLTGGWAAQAQKEKKEKKKPDRYSAVVLGTGGVVGGRSLQLSFIVDEYTGDEQVVEYLDLLREGGQDALRRALEKVRVGRVSPAGRIGGDIAVARLHKTGQGTLVRLFTARRMSFLELYLSGRSTQYPFAMFEFQLDEEGRGEGAVIAGARVRFNKENQLEVESLGQQYLKLANVRKEK